MSYIKENKTTITFEVIPERCPDDEEVTFMCVGYSDDIDLDEDSEEYRESMRELAINVTRSFLLTMVEKGVYTADELALLLAEKVYLPLKADLLAMQNPDYLREATTIKDIVLDEEEDAEDDQ